MEGFTNNDEDLERALIYKAEAVIILSDKFSFEADHEDTNTILEAMIIKKYLSNLNKISGFKSETRICMQLLRPDSLTHYELSLTPEEIKTD